MIRRRRPPLLFETSTLARGRGRQADNQTREPALEWHETAPRLLYEASGRRYILAADGENWTLDLLIGGEYETELAVDPQLASTLNEAMQLAQKMESERRCARPVLQSGQTGSNLLISGSKRKEFAREVMDVKRTATAAVIAAGIGISAFTMGTGAVSAVPLDPPPSPTIPGGPGSVDEPTAPTDGGVAPHSGGSQHGGTPATVEKPPPGTS